MHRISALVLGMVPWIVLAVLFPNFLFLFAVLGFAWFALWFTLWLRVSGTERTASANYAATSFSLGDAGVASFGATSNDCAPSDGGAASCDAGGGGGADGS